MRGIDVVTTMERARALLEPERLRLLEALVDAPDSAAGLARRLGEKRQRLNYHLRALEATGFIEVVEERAHGGLAERVYRPSARRFLVDPTLSDAGGTPVPTDRGTAERMMAVAARVVHELAGLQEAAGEAAVAAPSLDAVVRLESAEVLEEFAGALGAAVAGVIGRYHRPGSDGIRVRLVAGIYRTTL